MKNNSTQRSDGQQTIVNSYEPGVSDELAIVNDSKSIADSLESTDSNQNIGVNDDMAACHGVSETTIVTFTKVPYNNGLDPGRASGSFVSLCQIILQPIFNTVELFKDGKPVLIPVRVKK
jgi:hypothetical protein